MQRVSHFLTRGSLTFVLLMLVLGSVSCTKGSISKSSGNTAIVAGITCEVLEFPVVPLFAPSHIEAGDKYYIPQNTYDAYAQVMELFANKFEKRQAYSDEELKKAAEKVASLNQSDIVVDQSNKLQATARNEKELKSFNSYAFVIPIQDMLNSYDEKINRTFFEYGGTAEIETKLKLALQDQELCKQILFANMLIPKCAIKIYPYIDIAKYSSKSNE